MRAELVVDALRIAIARRRPEAGLIHLTPTRAGNTCRSAARDRVAPVPAPSGLWSSTFFTGRLRRLSAGRFSAHGGVLALQAASASPPGAQCAHCCQSGGAETCHEQACEGGDDRDDPARAEGNLNDG